MMTEEDLFGGTDKEVIEEYLKASGIVNASLHLGRFTENLWT
jgi:hypothetical protein